LHERSATDFSRPREVDRPILDKTTLPHDNDAVGQKQGLFYVMGHQQYRGVVALPELGHDGLRFYPGESVQRRERLIQQEQSRFSDKGSG
jgi:hypothetical protein